MVALMASYTSSQYCTDLGEILEPDSYNEGIATAILGGRIFSVPLGVYFERSSCNLYSRFFEGTILYRAADEVYELCVSFPYDARPFFSVLSGNPQSYSTPTAIHTPCLKVEGGVQLELAVLKRVKEDDHLRVLLVPLHAKRVGYSGRAYARWVGCSIELLVAYSRIKFWSSRRPPPCRLLQELLRTVRSSLSCVERSTKDLTIIKEARKFAERSTVYFLLSGCAPP
jgi:hypothetical protein